MESHIDTSLVLQMVGVITLVLGGGVAWGQQQNKIKNHQKIIDDCKMGELMTEAKCKGYHETHQASTNVHLDNITKALDGIAKDNKDSELRLGSLASRIDIIFDRWERNHE